VLVVMKFQAITFGLSQISPGAWVSFCEIGVDGNLPCANSKLIGMAAADETILNTATNLSAAHLALRGARDGHR
jgi:hypothetical protein